MRPLQRKRNNVANRPSASCNAGPGTTNDELIESTSDFCYKFANWNWIDDLLSELQNSKTQLQSCDTDIAEYTPISCTFSDYSEYCMFWIVRTLLETQASILSELLCCSFTERFSMIVHKHVSTMSEKITFSVNTSQSSISPRLSNLDVCILSVFESSEQIYRLIRCIIDNSIPDASLVQHVKDAYILAVLNSSADNNRTLTFVVPPGTFIAANSTVTAYPFSSLVSVVREISGLFKLSQNRLVRDIIGFRCDAESKVDCNEENSTSSLKRKRLPNDDQELTEQRHFDIPKPLSDYLSIHLNESQLRAILAPIVSDSNKSNIHLIQGPPGTGKTTTLISLLNLLHVKQYNTYYETMIDIVINTSQFRFHSMQADAVDRMISLSRLKKPHLLVTCPSNAAIDNIVSRVVKDGFMDGNANKYFPHMTRVGGVDNRANDDSISRIFLHDQVNSFASLDYVTLLTEMERISREIDASNRILSDARAKLQGICLGMHAWHERKRHDRESTSCNLPSNIEIRVDDKCMFYYVDHVKMSTSYNSSSIVENDDAAVDGAATNSNNRNRHVELADVCILRLKSMPEFQFFANKLTREGENLTLLNLHRQRLELVTMYLKSECLSEFGTRQSRFGKRRQRRNFASNEEARELDIPFGLRDSLESLLLDTSDIVLTTLNSCGNASMVGCSVPFEMAVVDEAAQAVELSTLIPLQYGCKTCVLVGDPNQLPATVFASKSRSNGYQQSLFERLARLGHPVQLLDIQYRMHPLISAFPNRRFYRSMLHDGEAVFRSQEIAIKHPFKPFMFIDLLSSSESVNEHGGQSRGSKCNSEEAKLAVKLVEALRNQYCVERYSSHRKSSSPIDGRIAILTPYNAQIDELKSRFLTRFGVDYDRIVDISTVDGYQGRENNIVVFSCVRSSLNGIGFLSDFRRMNVGLTRAKNGLFVIGNKRSLQSNANWRELVLYSEAERLFITIEDAATANFHI